MVSFKRNKRNRLCLNVTICEAANLVEQSLFSKDILNMSPKCHLTLPPSASSKTRKAKDPMSPHWNTTCRLRLKSPPLKVTDKELQRLPPAAFLILTIQIVNNKGSNRTYLGELRIAVLDLLTQLRANAEIGPKWYKLYSSEHEHTFVTGSIKCKFSLTSRRRKSRTQRVGPEIVVQPESGPTEVYSEEEYDESDDEINQDQDLSSKSGLIPVENEDLDTYIEQLRQFRDLLIAYGKNPSSLITINEQNFYSDIPALADSQGASPFGEEVVEEESSDEENKEPSFYKTANISTESIGSLVSSTDEMTNYTSASLSDMPLTPPTSSSLTSQRRRRFGKIRRKLPEAHYEFSTQKNFVGMLFIEIISASGLPPMHNTTRTGYDMDPFVVISFGTKVYRTSWRKHTLNPIFNERLAFEVLENEKTFNINFNILDKDYWSLNDPVCEVSIPIRRLISSPSSSTDMKVVEREEEENLIYRRKLFGRNPKKNVSSTYDGSLKTLEVKMNLDPRKTDRYTKIEKVDPKLKIRVRFESYAQLRRQLFIFLLKEFQVDGSSELDIIELESFLDSLGSNLSEEDLVEFFDRNGKKAWHGQKLTFDEISDEFERIFERKQQSPSSQGTHIIQIARCPSCLKRARAHDDVDIIKHLAICCSQDWSSVTRILKPSFTTPSSASRRWYTKALIKIAYGKIELGKNNANILVQDRDSGLIIEEKMNFYVRLGIRLLYRSFKGKRNSERIKRILKNLSVKQGSKFDNPASKSKIESFIKFHSLDLTDCLIQDVTQYSSFNDFFYRKLKPDARPLEGSSDKYAVSGADCRCCVFPSIEDSRKIWIKGKDFTVEKLLGPKFSAEPYANGSIVIFRLAPQDYHRFHSSISGTITKIEQISGEYYTVNPMAIRSRLDVYGENTRVNVEISSPEFGKVIMSCVGAMMVGSIILTCKVGDSIRRGDEVGYFKFGGSTVLLLFEKDRIVLDSDLVSNSKNSIETLIRVGMSIGHVPQVAEFKREHTDLEKEPEETRLKIIRTLTGRPIDESSENINSWEVQNLDLDDAVSVELEDEGSESSS
ncbi:hypothetical protein OGAPHI_002762 [Ogataea philodendri]|uniref:Phosphatidylserine decarboxylase proenzyme 2 n=1 Tax=Ogataea philodendri TaxID=1378263 RepID=A0A9P8PBU7_9ASCO|nr:uncharacterized protein OGAPHI_002762 [Ogataea philodendri]KAH3669007.1 hypothetical protein OGAPHI_002762 [Ogataea philodendri]